MELLKATVILTVLHVMSVAGGQTVGISSHLQHLATHRYPNEEQKEAREKAVEYIASQFEECGLRVDLQRLKAFAAPKSGDTLNYSLYGQDASEVRGVNIIGLSGPVRDEVRSVVVVGAAYDTDGVGSPVRDNGAGVAVLLETARQYQATMLSPHFATLFVAFDLSTDRYGRKGARDGSGGGGGGLPGAYSLVQDYLRRFVNQNTSTVDGAIVLGPLMNVNPETGSQNFDSLTKLFPTAHEEIRAREYRGDFVAMVSGGSEAERTLAKRMMDSYGKVGGRLVEFSLGNHSHTLLPPSLPAREAAYFWQSTFKGLKSPLPAILLTDTETNRAWPSNAPPPTQLTEAQEEFLDTTVNGLVQFLVQRQPERGAEEWREVGLVIALLVSCAINILLVLHIHHLCSTPSSAKMQGDAHSPSETLSLQDMRSARKDERSFSVLS